MDIASAAVLTIAGPPWTRDRHRLDGLRRWANSPEPLPEHGSERDSVRD
jgi:hypothetical protein